MNRVEKKEFFYWLDTADEKERLKHRNDYITVFLTTHNLDTSGDCAFKIKHIEDSLLADIVVSDDIDEKKIVMATHLREHMWHHRMRYEATKYIDNLHKKVRVKYLRNR